MGKNNILSLAKGQRKGELSRDLVGKKHPLVSMQYSDRTKRLILPVALMTVEQANSFPTPHLMARFTFLSVSISRILTL